MSAEAIPVRCILRTFVSVIEELHPRELIKTDLWRYTRADNIAAIGELRYLNDMYPVIPPPVTGVEPHLVRVWARLG